MWTFNLSLGTVAQPLRQPTRHSGNSIPDRSGLEVAEYNETQRRKELKTLKVLIEGGAK